MRSIVWLMLLALVAVVAATTFGPNDGLVSIYWGGWRTDLSLNLFVILLLGGCVLVMSAAQAIGSLVSLPRRAGEWRALRRERAAQAVLREALVEFFAARYGRARKAAERALAIADGATGTVGDAEFRALALLLGAASLHRLQDRQRRDEFLRLALKAGKELRGGPGKIEEASRLLAAEWALEDRDAPRAVELLEALPPGASRRTQALRLKLQALRMVRRPLDALHSAHLLAKHGAFSKVVAQTLLRSLAAEGLDSVHDLQQLRRLWSQFDVADQRDPVVAARAAQRAVLLEAPTEAREWLRPFWDQLAELPREDREQLALALIDARSGIGVDWLPRLESAVQTFGHEPAVVAAVGLAYAERGLWGKARPLLTQAAGSAGLPARTRRAAWRQLAGLAREEADETQAVRFEQAAAALD